MGDQCETINMTTIHEEVVEHPEAKRVLSTAEYDRYSYLMGQFNQLGPMEAEEMYKRKRILYDAWQRISVLMTRDYQPTDLDAYAALRSFLALSLPDQDDCISSTTKDEPIDLTNNITNAPSSGNLATEAPIEEGSPIEVATSRRTTPRLRRRRQRPLNLLVNRKHLRYLWSTSGRQCSHRPPYSTDDTDDESLNGRDILLAGGRPNNVIWMNSLWRGRANIRMIINAFFKRVFFTDLAVVSEILDIEATTGPTRYVLDRVMACWATYYNLAADRLIHTTPHKTFDAVFSGENLETLFDTLFGDYDLSESDCRIIVSYLFGRTKVFEERLPGSMGHLYSLHPFLAYS